MISIQIRRTTSSFLTLFLTGVLLGCSAGNPPFGGLSNPSNSGLVFSDIAVPPGTTVKLKESIIMGTDGRWTGLIVGRSESTLSDASKYIMRQMIAKGWSLVSSVHTEDTSLVFTRPDKSLQIDIKNAGFMQSGSIIKYYATNK